MILLDTHVVLWLTAGSERLGVRARALIDRSYTEGRLGMSTISFWEIGMLVSKGRVRLDVPPEQLRRDLLETGLLEIPLDGEAALAATSLAKFHADPADRFIIATAIASSATLLTADSRILGWKGKLKSRDARV